MTYDVDRVRARIPALADGTAYFDGPGGTQTPDVVAQAIADALTAGLSNRGRTTRAERNADDITVGARLAGAEDIGVFFRDVVRGGNGEAGADFFLELQDNAAGNLLADTWDGIQ